MSLNDAIALEEARNRELEEYLSCNDSALEELQHMSGEEALEKAQDEFAMLISADIELLRVKAESFMGFDLTADFNRLVKEVL